MPTILQLRKEAALKGLTRFNTGEPCRQGHYSDRYVSSGQCIQCVKPVSIIYGNAHTATLRAAPLNFWVPKEMTAEQWEALKPTLQHWIYEWCTSQGIKFDRPPDLVLPTERGIPCATT